MRMLCAPMFAAQKTYKAPAASRGGVRAVSIQAATINLGGCETLKKQSKRELIFIGFRRLLSNNEVVCVQEAKGLVDDLNQIAYELDFGHTEDFEGMMIFYNIKSVTKIKEHLQPIWPTFHPNGNRVSDKASWRRLQCAFFTKVHSPEDPVFLVCNNHTLVGSNNHKAGNNNAREFKHRHLQLCFEAVEDVAKSHVDVKDHVIIPILMGDHNVDFNAKTQVSDTVPHGWHIVAGKLQKRDFVFAKRTKS